MTEAYLEGNRYYKESNYDAAYACYSKAISTGDEGIALRSLLNRAACSLKLRNFDQCVLDCSTVLKQDPSHAKARLRRAIAHEDNGNYAAALEDVQAALETTLDGSLLRLARTMFHRLRNAVRVDHFAVRQERGHASFITRAQTIRLCISHQPPRIVSTDTPLDFDFFLANELGLWSPDLLEDVSQLSSAEVAVDPLVVPAVTADLTLSVSVDIMSPGKFSLGGKLSLRLKLSFTSEGADAAVVSLRFRCIGMEVSAVLSLPILVLQAESCFIQPTALSSRLALHEKYNPLIDALSLGEQVHPQCIREQRTAQSLPSYVFECPGYVSIGGKVWDATFALMDYLFENAELIRGRRVVELGCGTGLLSLSLATLDPAAVFLTDIGEVVQLTQANIDLNALMYQGDDHLSSTLRSRFKAVEYSWGASDTGISETLLPCDVVIAADVVYDSDSFARLVQSIHDLLGSSKSNWIGPVNDHISDSPKMILAFRNRGNEEDR